MEYLLGYLLIFTSRVVDVSLTTIRTLLVVKSMKVYAAIIGFFEISIYVMALNTVMNNLDNPLNLLTYALGFSCGTYVGIVIENKIALGNLSIQIVPSNSQDKGLKALLRKEGFATTVVIGEGLHGDREILFLTINRKRLGEIKDIVYGYDERAFMTVNDVHSLTGGHFTSGRATSLKK